MVLRQELSQPDFSEIGDSKAGQATETSVYITDLLGELQTIARIGGLTKLSDDIKVVMVRHLTGEDTV